MIDANFLKQVCIYGFSSAQLRAFARQKTRTPLEEAGDIEILRFVEPNQVVKMIPLENRGVAVDEPKDVLSADEALRYRSRH